MQHSQNIKRRVTSEIIFGVLFLVCGCVIYLLFRSKSLNIYQWCVLFGLSDTIDTLRQQVQNWDISEFVKFSLPDGLYCAAYILMIDAVWYKGNTLAKYIIISLVPFITISSEVLQYYGLVKGTFDMYDLICYATPPMIYLIYNYNSFKFNNLKFQRL